MPNRPQKTLLIIDRDETHLRELTPVLSSIGTAADHASSTSEAVAMLELYRYAVVLLDLATSRNGINALARCLREMPEALSPVVIIVAEAGEEPGDGLDASRIHGIMRRPVDAEELAALALTCSELAGIRALDTMCVAMLAGTPLLAILAAKF